MTDSIKRLNYFNGQFLRAPDFTEEQTYHLEMGRRHNQKLHTWGIADGLKLQYTIGSSQIEIAEGMAIDSEGREIVLVNKVNRDLSTFPGKTVYITIAYNERKVDETKETGVEGFTRVQEIPNINVSENPPSADQLSLQLILGRVTVNSEGKITATDEGEGVNRRRAAGVVAGDLEARSLTLTDTNVDPSQWSRMRLGAAGRADLQSNLRVTGNLEVTGTVDGRDVSADGTRLDTHTSNTNNPHQTTAAQIDNQGGTNRLVTQINASTGVISEGRIDPAIARDSEVTTAINLAVKKAGDTMTGALTIQSNLTVTGNVSLGSLTVNGRMSVSDGVIQRGGAPLTTTADLGLYSQLDSQWIRFVTKNAPFLFYSDGGAGTTPMFIIEPSGNVKATSFLGDGSTLTGVVRTAGDTMTGALTIQNNLTVTGKVGIATTATPSERLEVNGNIKATSFLGDGSTLTGVVRTAGDIMTGALTIQNNLTVTGKVGIATTAAPSEKLEVNGNIKATSFLGDGSNLTGVVKNLDLAVKKAGDIMTGALTIQNNLTVTGSVSFGSQVRQMLNLWSTGYGIGVQNLTQYFRSDANFAWYKGGSHNDEELNPGGGAVQMVIKDGNVGIGTTNPGTKLEINGDLKVTGTITGTIDATNIATGTLNVARIPNLSANKIIDVYDIYLRGSAFESTEGNITFLKIANFDFGLTTQRGLNTIILNPGGAYRRKANHDVYGDKTNWNNWADWVNSNAAAGDLVAVASYDALSKAPRGGSAATLLDAINGKQAFSAEYRVSYALFFIKGESKCIEVLQAYRGPNAHLKTGYAFSQLSFNFNNFNSEEAWIVPAFMNSWTNYDTTYNPAGYFKDSLGIVHLRGLVKNGTNNTTIFTLPVGYRPSNRELQAVQTNLNTIGRVDILADGQVTVVSGSNVWVSLDGITFRAGG
ncbi:MAG: hypothetical protein O9287_14965 [Microcystis sp. LE17-20D]|jgi:cytoskeletal protein CcmA (bactofilin family)|nr:hypothetical protein [Microcystis sp. LE17-20D]MCZ8067198.1 hypothetical protein [Microcystis sp. LE17-20D]